MHDLQRGAVVALAERALEIAQPLGRERGQSGGALLPQAAGWGRSSRRRRLVVDEAEGQPLLDGCEDVRLTERLGDDVVAAGRENRCAIVIERAGRERDDDGARATLLG